MSFAWPHLLWLLALPLALFAWELTHRRRAAALARPKILRAEAGPRSLRLTMPEAQPVSAAGRPRPWLCLGLCLALLALARPQWGRLEEPVFDQSREILLAVDLSRSMLTPDVKPSRLDRAKLLIQSLLEKLQGERVGLVVFAGTAFLQSPLSADYEILREFLPALGPEFLPQGGSNYGALLDASIQAFGATNSADRFLVVLSDGEATDDEWKSHLPKLKEKGIRVLGLGVGTAEGAMIPDGAGGLVKDERGAVVMSKLESATLQELARATDGVYRDASSWVDLATLVRETIETGRRGEFVEKNTVRLVERFQWPLALAVWFLCVSFYYEFPVRPRVRDLRLSPPDRPEAARASAVVTALLLLAGLVLWPATGHAAVKLAPAAPATPGAASAAGNAPGASASVADAAPLGKIVGRLAGLDAPSGRDWAEFARETVTWGSRLKSGGQPVPETPVRDALAAVKLGAKLDPKTADWTKLREELEALLEKKDEENKDQQDQPQDQDQQPQDQKQQKQDQKQKNQQQQKDQQDPQDPQQKDDAQQNDPDNDPPQQDRKQPQPGESAFGDMNKKDQPPPPEPPPADENMQKVGGAEKKPEPEQTDPSLALPLQKLDQLRNQDSPAQLFQLMEGDKKPTKKPAKDW
jgi:Ca-activated chloride channel family protein